jgi:phenylalanyl-tRNA synthetase beta chain
MKASYRWLRSLVPQLTASPQELAHRLTQAGLEVESVSHFGEACESCLVVRVVSIRPHPKKDGLRLVTVDRGDGTIEVVCGAPNVPEPGGLVVLAPLGVNLPAVSMRIESRAVGGVVSEGMLCSERELGLSDESNGILVLAPGSASVGAPLAAAVPETSDHILEIGLTPNRSDCLGHIGLAREISVLYDFVFTSPSTSTKPATSDGEDLTRLGVRAHIRDAASASSYSLGGAFECRIGPSPLWLRYRLSSLGVRSISNVVDITNLVMLEFGHPMHAFDMDKLQGLEIEVRKARAGETLQTLDGKDRTLDADDLVIADGKGPVALAGVMGGSRTEVDATTKRVLFECATFTPRVIRRGSRRHGIHSESSHRFERGVDPQDEAAALATALRWSEKLAGAKLSQNTVRAQTSTEFPKTVRLRASRMRSLLGVDVPWKKATVTLIQLGCTVVRDTGAVAEVQVPSHRSDIAREVDLIEEVIRVHGMDSLPGVLPRVRASVDVGGKEARLREVKAAATRAGFSEAVILSLTSQAALTQVHAPAPTVILENALAEHANALRTAILPSLLRVAKEASNRGAHSGALFSVGPVFTDARDSEGLPVERLELAAILYGENNEYLSKGRPWDVFDLKGRTETLFEQLGFREIELVPQAFPQLHPRGSARLVDRRSGRALGELGPLHPELARALDQTAMVLRLDVETMHALLMQNTPPQYKVIPRFPSAPRDISLFLQETIPVGRVVDALASSGGDFLRSAFVLDRYQGEGVPEKHVSYTIRLDFGTPDRTLTDAEVEAALAAATKAISKDFEARVRG